jgi:hypothetical protein
VKQWHYLLAMQKLVGGMSMRLAKLAVFSLIGSLMFLSCESRSIELSMDFLDNGPYHARIYSDGLLADENPASISIRDITVSATDMITIDMASGGDHILYLTPVM